MSKPLKEDQLKVKVPTRIPRPLAKDVGQPTGAEDPMTLSPLGIYMQTTGNSTSMMARAIGVAHKTILELRTGVALPSLVMAYEIERVTKGAVPMEAWLGTAKGKMALAAQRAKQPEDVQRQAPALEAGGFAQPPKKGPATKKKGKSDG